MVVVRVVEMVAEMAVAAIVHLHVVIVAQAVLTLPAAAIPPLARTIDETVTIAEIATETSMTDAALAALPIVIAIGIVT